MLVALGILLVLTGVLTFALAPIIAWLIIAVMWFVALRLAFYLVMGLVLLPVEIPVLVWGTHGALLGDRGAFVVCYGSPIAWLFSLLVWGSFGLLVVYSDEIASGCRDARAAARARRDEKAAQDEHIALALTGRQAVLEMVKQGNAAALARLHDETYIAATRARRYPPPPPPPPPPPMTPAEEAEWRRNLVAKLRADEQVEQMARLNERIDELTYYLACQSNQPQQINVQLAWPEPEPEPEPTLHQSITNALRGIGTGMVISGGAAVGYGAVASRRNQW